MSLLEDKKLLANDDYWLFSVFVLADNGALFCKPKRIFLCCVQHGVQLPGASWVLCNCNSVCQSYRDHDTGGPDVYKEQAEWVNRPAWASISVPVWTSALFCRNTEAGSGGSGWRSHRRHPAALPRSAGTQPQPALHVEVSPLPAAAMAGK